MSQYDGWLHSGLPSPYDGQLHDSGPLDTGGPIIINPDPIGTDEAVGQPTVTTAPPPPLPAWSSIGKPIPRRPRRREREHRLITTTSRLRVECDSRVRASSLSATALSSHSVASVTVRGHGLQVIVIASLARVRAFSPAGSQVRSDVEVAVSRRDAPELEALLLGLL